MANQWLRGEKSHSVLKLLSGLSHIVPANLSFVSCVRQLSVNIYTRSAFACVVSVCGETKARNKNDEVKNWCIDFFIISLWPCLSVSVSVSVSVSLSLSLSHSLNTDNGKVACLYTDVQTPKHLSGNDLFLY